MKRFELAATIILVSIGVGLLAVISFPISELESNASPQPSNQEVHEHALFHVVINGSEVDFTSEEFQLEARNVHLENNKSDIVHKHAEGVTWKQFLNTVKINATRSNSTGNLCVQIRNQVTCGDGEIVLNGEQIEDLGQVINQGDHFLIVLNTDNPAKIVNEYMKQQLPQDYKPQSITGRRV